MCLTGCEKEEKERTLTEDERIKIEDKGYKDGQGGRGSLIAEVKTVVPKQLTEQEQDLFKKLEEISTFNPRDTLKI